MNTLLVVAITLLPSVDPPTEQNKPMEPTQGRLTADSNLYSGPGTHYYTVIEAKQDQLITIVEQKHGWLGIQPIKGAFSLVPKEFVDTTPDDTRGIINDKQVWVHAGSTLSGKNFVKQTRLPGGTSVDIIGTRDGYYMIVPPPAARLWIRSDLVDVVEDVEIVASDVEQPTIEQGDPIVAQSTSAVQDERTADPPAKAARPKTEPIESAPVATSTPTPRAPTTDSAPAMKTIDQLEGRLREEYTKNLLERNLTPIIEGFQQLAGTATDEETVAYANYRANQLMKVRQRVMALNRLNSLDREVKEQRKQFMIDRADIRPSPPLVTRDYAVTGRLLKSFAYTNPSGPQRFRLVEGNEPDLRTVAYVEIEPVSGIDPELFLGRFVGVRARTKRLLQGAVEPVIIYTAAELVVLEEAPVAEEAPADNT